MSPEEMTMAREEHRREYCQKYCPKNLDGHCETHEATQDRIQKSEHMTLLIKTLFKPAVGLLAAIFLGLFGTLAGMYWMVADIKASAAVMAAVVTEHSQDIALIGQKQSDHLEGGAMELHKKLHDQMGVPIRHGLGEPSQ